MKRKIHKPGDVVQTPNGLVMIVDVNEEWELYTVFTFVERVDGKRELKKFDIPFSRVKENEMLDTLWNSEKIRINIERVDEVYASLRKKFHE